MIAKRRRNERGQAMVETVLLIAAVGLAAGFAFRALADGFQDRRSNLEAYYALPVP